MARRLAQGSLTLALVVARMTLVSVMILVDQLHWTYGFSPVRHVSRFVPKIRQSWYRRDHSEVEHVMTMLRLRFQPSAGGRCAQGCISQDSDDSLEPYAFPNL